MGHGVENITVGVDIGGTHVKSVSFSSDFELLSTHSVATNAASGPDMVRQSVRSSVLHHLSAGRTLHSLGIGCAGSIDPARGVVRFSPHFPNFRDVSLREWSQTDFSIEATIENDANCAAFAEWKRGCGRNTSNLVLLTLGTGIGGGIILNNQIFRGSTGTGGELGHFSLNSKGELCPCGNRGCFERYCSASALQRNYPQFSSKEIFQRHSEAPFKNICDSFVEDLSTGIISLTNIFDPDVVVVGGAISAGLQPFLGKIRSLVWEHAYPGVRDHVKVEFATLGAESGAIGAALLAADRR